MNKIILLSLLFIGQLSYSQMKEGMIQYTIDVQAVDTAIQTRQTAAMLRNSMMKIYFAKDLLRIDYKMGKITDMKMIIDYYRNSSLSLVVNPKGQYAILKKADELEYPEDPSKNSTIKLLSDTRKVLGYNCKKAVITSGGIETTYWYTNEIDIDFKDQQFYDKKIPGFPMIFSTIQNGMLMSYQVSNIEGHLIDKQTIFSIIPPVGYQVISQ